MTTASDRQRLRIAIDHIPPGQWTGGTHYLRNLCHALRGLGDADRPELVLVAPEGTAPADYAPLQPYLADVVAHPPADAWPGFAQRQWIRLRKLAGAWRAPEHPLSRRLREHGVDAFFARADFGDRFEVPLLAWITDFQHLHLPELCSELEIQGRDGLFRGIVRRATLVVVSSEDARSDLERFSPGAGSRARVLSFVAAVPESVWTPDPAEVAARYHLPERFVFLPNQFWKHKNHEVVIRALDLARRTAPDLTVVCTGNTNEFRHPHYFSELLAEVSRMNLRGNLIILGMVPHGDVFQLIRQSLAVLQPSRFEGWNTCIEEVKSIGKRMIVSDLAVHREQAPPETAFFDPLRPEALADALSAVFAAARPGPDAPLEAQARAQLPVRARRFAETFVRIAREAIAAGRPA